MPTKRTNFNQGLAAGVVAGGLAAGAVAIAVQDRKGIEKVQAQIEQLQGQLGAKTAQLEDALAKQEEEEAAALAVLAEDERKLLATGGTLREKQLRNTALWYTFLLTRLGVVNTLLGGVTVNEETLKGNAARIATRMAKTDLTLDDYGDGSFSTRGALVRAVRSDFVISDEDRGKITSRGPTVEDFLTVLILKAFPEMREYLQTKGVDPSFVQTSVKDLLRKSRMIGEKPCQATDIATVVNDVKKELTTTIGLREVKQAIWNFVKEMTVITDAEARRRRPLRFIFMGNPGTGKTRMAQLVHRILCKLGLLEWDKFVEIRPEQIREQADDAVGGTLFIDEAHNMSKKHILQLMEFVDTHKQTVVILAGYREPLSELLAARDPEKSDPGLDRRFPDGLKIIFEDYTDRELAQMMWERLISREGFVIIDIKDRVKGAPFTPTQRKSVLKHLTDLFANNFSREFKSKRNGGLVENKVNELFFASALEFDRRCRESKQETKTSGPPNPSFCHDSPSPLSNPSADQVRTAASKNALVFLNLFKRVLRPGASFNKCPGAIPTTKGEEKALIDKTLDGFLGRPSVHASLQKIITRAKALKKSPKLSTYMNIIITGPAGTGKTSLGARLKDFMCTLGLVTRPSFVEIKGSSMIGSYVGQTTPLANQQLAKGKGGLLFLDEGDALAGTRRAGSSSNEYKRDAVKALMSFVEEEKKSTIVMLAIYKADLPRLLAMDQGLASRFPIRIELTTYTTTGLATIMLMKVKEHDKPEFKNEQEKKRAIAELKKAFEKVSQAKWEESNARLLDGILVDAVARWTSGRLWQTVVKLVNNQSYRESL